MSNAPEQLHVVRRPYSVSGYAVVAMASSPGPDEADWLERIAAYVRWLKRYRFVELTPLLSDEMKGDEAVLPVSLRRWPWLVLRAWWLNRGRKKANVEHAKRMAAYFSPGNAAARAMANTLPSAAP